MVLKNQVSVIRPLSWLFIFVAALLLAWLGFSRQAETKPVPVPAKGHRVLFVGNSLTYSNQMPLMVEALAKSQRDRIEVASVILGGASLEDLWRDGAALREIAKGGWTIVVLQQGPSSLPESRVELRKWTRKFAQRIRKVGGRPALYMVWPPRDRLAFFDDVSLSYTLAATDVRGMLFPAGEAWRAAWRRDPNAPLYDGDDFHPSEAGSYTAALSIYGMLFRKPLEGLPARLHLRDGSSVNIAPGLATLLQESATEANQEFGRP